MSDDVLVRPRGLGSSRGSTIVVSGPSGAGKTTILRRVLERDARLRFSVSHTTRHPRKGEVEGHDYYFVTQEKFRALIESGSFLEWAEYQGNFYGTSRAAVEKAVDEGSDVLLEVEVQGARQIREQCPDAVTVIVLPPSFEALGQRLRDRAKDSEESIRKRLDIAREEVREASQYTYVVVNSNLDAAVADLQKIVDVARLRPQQVLPQWWNGEPE